MNNNSKGDYNSKLITPEEVIAGIEATKGPLTEELKRVVIDKVNAENAKLNKATPKKGVLSVEETIAKIEANTGKVLTEEQRRIVRDKVNSENAKLSAKKASNFEFVDVSESSSKIEKPMINKKVLTPEEVINEIEKNKGVVLTEEQRRMVRDKLNLESKKANKIDVNFIEASEPKNVNVLTDEDINGLAKALDKHNTNIVSNNMKELPQLKITPEEVMEQIEKNTGVKLTDELKRVVTDKVKLENDKSSKKPSESTYNVEIEKIKEAIYNKIEELQNNSDDDSDDSDNLTELYKACDTLMGIGLEFSLPQKSLLKAQGIDLDKALGTTTYDFNDVRCYYGEDPIYDNLGNKINILNIIQD